VAKPLSIACAALMIATGCEGRLGDYAAGPAGTGRGPVGPDAPPIVPDGRCTAASVPIPVRRLSRVEYQRSVRDLLYGVAFDAPEIPADTAERGLENIARQLGAPALLVERYELTASRAAEAAIRDEAIRARIVPCESGASAAEQDACAERFLDAFGRRAFRRPLTAEERADFLALIHATATEIDFDAAIELAIGALIQSPQFHYRIETPTGEGRASAYQLASRLSYFLWQSAPDDALLDAAARGELSTPTDLETRARAMLEDPRAREAMIDFHRQWLDFDRVLGEPKDPATHPGWDATLRTAIREEVDRFVGGVVWGGEGTLGALLTSRSTWVDPALAEHYGLPAVSGWTRVELPEGERAGILTRSDFLAGRAHAVNGSPILRGAFVMDRLLCRALGSPPDDADTSPIVPDPDAGPMTNRMLFEARTASPTCQTCHAFIDGIGLGFEHYDATGRFRAIDNTLPVDATSTLVGTDVDGPYDGAVELSEMLAESTTVSDCAASHWARYALGRTPADGDACLVARAQASMRATGGDLRELMIAIVTSPDFAREAP
jgi:hypothetical protein